MKKHKDTEYLDWMIFYSAKVCHDREGENCYVEWYPSDYDWGKQRTGRYGCSREAIDNAIKREKCGDYK